MTTIVQSALVILRRKQVEQRTGLSRSSIYAKLKEKTFPAPVTLGPKSVGWIESEINSWISEQVAKRDESLAA